jgi:hypothetical protein
MGVIFGSDAIRAATIVTQAGAAGIDTWTRAANDQGLRRPLRGDAGGQPAAAT